MPRSPRLFAALSLSAAMALTGANVAFGKTIVAEIPVYVFVLFRFAIASAALALMAWTEQGPRLIEMNARQWRDLALMALLGMVGFTVLMFEGLRRTAAADAGIIMAVLPAVVAVFGVVFAGDRLSRSQLAAVVLAVAGLALVQGIGVGGGAGMLLGNALVVGAVLCEASFVVLGKRLAPPYRPLRLALGANLAGLAFSLPLAIATWPPGFDVRGVEPRMWLIGTWYALSASVFCLWLWYRALPHARTWLAGLATAAVPVAALAASALALGETIGPVRFAGAALVILAIVVGVLAADAGAAPLSKGSNRVLLRRQKVGDP
jgi:drug/metabolite transporter (DMT)-like permease